MANFLHRTTILYAALHSLIFPLDDLGYAREDTRIMTDEFFSWYSPTEENIVRPPGEVLLLLLPLHFIS